MASLFGHIAVSTAIGYAFFPKQVRPLTLVVAGFCAFAPDLDVLSFRFGIPYSSEWGHRGWTHSLAFALIAGGLIGLMFSAISGQTTWSRQTTWWPLTSWFVISMASHPLLDMLTNGGRGCALWWPFSTERIFFPWRPVQVSPMSVSDFISPWGLEVLASEVIWIGFPCMGLVLLARMMQSG
ncbi:MAG: metal-dependent hydrolase [Saprospiraceae bacterium]